MTTLTIELPDDLARDAEQVGLLSGPALHSLLRNATRIAALRRLQNMWAQAGDAQPTPPAMDPQELQAIIREVRRERLR